MDRELNLRKLHRFNRHLTVCRSEENISSRSRINSLLLNATSEIMSETGGSDLRSSEIVPTSGTCRGCPEISAQLDNRSEKQVFHFAFESSRGHTRFVTV
jgi:hypothetical protein